MTAERPWRFTVLAALKVPALFLVTLAVGLFTLAGAYGVQTLGLGLNALRDDARTRPSRGRLLAAWLALYMFVGCQMAWSLKPWVGTPYLTEFAAFRPSSTNFYAAVFGSAGQIGRVRR